MGGIYHVSAAREGSRSWRTVQPDAQSYQTSDCYTLEGDEFRQRDDRCLRNGAVADSSARSARRRCLIACPMMSLH